MFRTPEDSVIRGFTAESEKILGDNLAGIYLHGSAVMGCFNPGKSDIDLIIAVNRPMSASAKREFMNMTVRYNALSPAKGIEMSVVLREVCRPFVYPTPFELHFSAAHLEWYRRDPDDYIRKMNGTDRDLAAHFTVIYNRGRCLYGVPVREMFAEVPGSDYMDSIWNDVAGATEEIGENTMYLALNLARVMAYREDGLVLSKKEGGEWAADRVPEEYRPLIADALREYCENAEISYDKALAVRYAEYAVKRIQQEKGAAGKAGID